MSDPIACSYDEVPYGSRSILTAHPDRLSVVALLNGLTPAPLEACRVLEIGCAEGGNLLPQATILKGSQFVGIDLSPRQIEEGRATAAAVGLENVEFIAASIADLDPGLGAFDFILCHGVFSWVPDFVREAILQVIARHLAPKGVAYVSYNTYPGWYCRRLVREAMHYHARSARTPVEKVRLGREILEILGGSLPPEAGYFKLLVAQEREILSDAADSYVYHEFFEDENHPFYFREFMGMAHAHGLQFLGEANFTSLEERMPREHRDRLDQIAGDAVEREQYLDFMTNRTFRRTLLCRGDVALDRNAGLAAIAGLSFAALAEPESARPDIQSDAPETFRVKTEASLTTSRPLVKAMLTALAECWPRALSRDELWQSVLAKLDGCPRLDFDPAEGPLPLDAVVWRCVQSGLVEPYRSKPPFRSEISERPEATPLARLQAERGGSVTNLRHRTIELNDMHRFVLARLDGQRDRKALVADLESAIGGGAAEIVNEEGQALAPSEVASFLEGTLEEVLGGLTKQALLIG